ncbi:MAG: hypothetical protein J6Y55_08895 [Bacteroidales bacterium]|nr:hypothetical protein [Bacteroidales bacterium]
MKQYLRAFIPDFRPNNGPDASFDLRDFQDKDFNCVLEKNQSGIYIISSTDGTKYIYPNGKNSQIIYIGKSDNLLRRLKDEHYTKHLKLLLDNRDYGIEENFQLAAKYQYMYYNGSHVDVFLCRGKQESKQLESFFLNQFYKKYRALPVGNAARSYDE